MRAFPRHPRPVGSPRSSAYRVADHVPLKPWQVRERRFTRRGRRGVDAVEVAAFLDRVADDLAEVYAALDSSRREIERIREVLRAWQLQRAGADRAARW
ncbi:hypothetical protein C5N14_05665 [Micromonospora sp. MW-13]|uniref:DivIVA domain-containing protein n=1 Tax=Micromonospora sp. MW-13 TaxID=2094022 RepID=UPI000ED68860|nr:DivIVA domain-containing protein [Micromonospora sp. MW-13]RGC69896.1 hypothetical protein C5N14_05665 [Micromonospora sp. MW-13]